MKKLSLVACIFTAVVALIFWTPKADASSSYYTSNCQSCHGAVSTCNGCHGHGAHATSTKNTINVAGVTNKTTYAPGETVSVTIAGGYRTGWIRAILYDQNMIELARSTGPAGEGGGAGYPITLTASAPTTEGGYTWNIAWYGNKYDKSSSPVYGTRWTPDPNNPNHGQEIVSTNSFTVTAPAVNTGPGILWRNSATGAVGVWIMNGSTNTGYVNVGSAPVNWQISGLL